jgi:3-dehydroquinate synthase
VPTTLLSQVDSSVGGKTGVNHPLGKNMIGTFSQPSLVFIDIDTLRTLPEREFYSGMAEIIKYGVISDGRLFDTLQVDREDILAHGDSLVKIIKRSCEIKADIVSKDEREAGLRAFLNFGHTIGHAIETATGYKKYLHGEAISIGMVAAAKIAVRLGILKSQEAERIKELVGMYNLPCTVPDDLNVDDVISAMRVDKKAKAGRLNFVLPEAIGAVRIEEDVDRKLIKEILNSSRR